MMKSIITFCLLVLPFVLGLPPQEEEFVFDDFGEETSLAPTEPPRRKPMKFWHFGDKVSTDENILKPNTLEHVERDEVQNSNKKGLLHHFLYENPASFVVGISSRKNVGQHHVSSETLKKYKDLKNKDGTSHCAESEEQTFMTILLDVKFGDLKPVIKAVALKNLAGFLGLRKSALSIHAQGSKDSTVISSGSGNVKLKKEKNSTFVQWQIGCGGHLWSHQADLLKNFPEQAQDGSLAEAMELPVFQWRIVKIDSTDLLRNRRETGSGDYGPNGDNDEDYDDPNYEYDSYDDHDSIDDTEGITVPPRSSEPRGYGLPVDNEHPHRHHHGEDTIGIKAEEDIDEDDIVPVIRPTLEESINITASPLTTLSPRLTMTPQTTPTTTLSTTTTTTPSTTTQFIVSTTSPLPETTTILQSTISNSIEYSTTSGETSKPDVVQETTVMTNKINEDSESTLSIVTSNVENETMSTTLLTTLVNSIGVVATSTEKQEINITTNEAPETTELSTSTTQIPTSTVQTSSSTTLETETEKLTTIIPKIISTSTTTTTTTTTTMMMTTTTPAAESTLEPATISTTMSKTTEAPTTITTTLQPRTTTTEKIEYRVKNYPPRQDRRLKKIPVTAGKPLSYVIPANTFSDIEDGDTRNLRLSLYLKGSSIKDTHWLQFNSKTQEIYGLPVETDVSIWDYDLVASDREGLNVSDRLNIYVQQHKLSRSVNHGFSIYLKIDKRTDFVTNIDWELKVVKGLAKLYGDSDTNQITVRSIDIDQDQAIFTWTNDSIPRSDDCPKNEINKLLDVLIANQDGDPSIMLQNVLAPEIRVKRVVSQGIGQCENINQKEVPIGSTEEPKINEGPMPRNQVDHINATVGELLIFKVPEDTFYDHEDGSARNMKMSLLTIDRTPIPPNDWLQFDSKNQEFYGIPLEEDLRHPRREYQLIVTDKEGESANDGLVVVVHPAPNKRHPVEFSMTLDVPYSSFAHSAFQKRIFIEKLAELFSDKDTSMISLNKISEGSTVVTWRNNTLPTEYCPNTEITRLMSVLSKPDKTVSERVSAIMDKEFPVVQINRTPMGICLGQMTSVYTPDNFAPPSGKSKSIDSTSNDDYLITFILPAIIIVAMILLAGIIALVLYRRRRSGKMSVSEHDDERQSFRSKGIPVIFQDELEEKPDPGNKSPVILKEEKPPLPPPEYQKSDDDGADEPMLPKGNSEEPYQPPPPFARTPDNNRQNRPKPTPTYRKPPPYVPP